MPMRERIIRITADLGGMTTTVGEVRITGFAKVIEQETEKFCPKCGAKPGWVGYECSCGQRYSHWSYLKRILKSTGQEILKATPYTQKGEIVEALAYILDRKTFADKYADATLAEKGIVAKDAHAANNIRNLIIATEQLGMVVIVAFKDTYEERTCLLTHTLSNRVVLKEIIHMNILELEETMRCDTSQVRPDEIERAKKLVANIPPPTEEVFICHDHRAIGVEQTGNLSDKVVELEAILRQAEQRKLA